MAIIWPQPNDNNEYSLDDILRDFDTTPPVWDNDNAVEQLAIDDPATYEYQAQE